MNQINKCLKTSINWKTVTASKSRPGMHLPQPQHRIYYTHGQTQDFVKRVWEQRPGHPGFQFLSLYPSFKPGQAERNMRAAAGDFFLVPESSKQEEKPLLPLSGFLHNMACGEGATLEHTIPSGSAGESSSRQRKGGKEKCC